MNDATLAQTHPAGHTISGITLDYLTHEGRDGRPLTPGSYCTLHLRGKAKRYMCRYYTRLIRDLSELERSGSVTQVPSVRGGLAWQWSSDGGR